MIDTSPAVTPSSKPPARRKQHRRPRFTPDEIADILTRYETETAAALDPGTVYGYGRTREEAWWRALCQRSDVLSAEGRLGGVPEYVDPQEAQPWPHRFGG